MRMRTHYHRGIKIEHALKNWSEDDREHVSRMNECGPEEVKNYFINSQNEGKRFVPAEPCDNFDDLTGCRGHLVSS